MISRLLLTLISLITLCACHNEEMERHSIEVSVSHLKSLCTEQHHLISDDYHLRGIVIASDWLGELYKSIIIADESGCIEVMVDVRDINTKLPVFSEVELYCNGLILARVGGNIKMGTAATDEFLLGNIDEDALLNYIHIINQSKSYTPETKHFVDINERDIGSIVRFEGVRIAEEEQGLQWCDTMEDKVVTTYRTLVDSEGNRFALRTLSTCVYATEKMPQNEISVIGAIDYADDRYFLTIVNKQITQ